jgi:subtilase family serine protease
MAATAVTAADSSFYSNNCFDKTETDVFSTNNDGEYPIGRYKGNHLNLQSLTSAGCGYTPPMIQAAYGLKALYAEGYDGTGQTIGIIDWCGSLTIQSDANAFSARFGLPPLTSSNFAITYVPKVSLCEKMNQVEINIDVEWAHAIAPGANINLIVPPSASFADGRSRVTAVTYGLANAPAAMARSIFHSDHRLETENLINEIAAVSGISANFSSGDDGDFSSFGIRRPSRHQRIPYATRCGRVAPALRPTTRRLAGGMGQRDTAEGHRVRSPLSFGFVGGAGGGRATAFMRTPMAAAWWFPQACLPNKLPGQFRRVPDISGLRIPSPACHRDPLQIPSLTWQVWGGTSWQPMFSALWAIANQEAAAPLGLAAAYLYSLPAGAVTDIVPVGSTHNVTGSIQESPTVKVPYSAAQMLGDSASGKFVSAIWDYAPFETTALIISFGTDCSAQGPADFGTLCNDPAALKTKIGWDNVTASEPNENVRGFVPSLGQGSPNPTRSCRQMAMGAFFVSGAEVAPFRPLSVIGQIRRTQYSERIAVETSRLHS